MKKLVLSVLAVLLGLVSYFLTFSAFYDSWFPYYYEEYISYFFFAGAAVILISPYILVMLQKLKNTALLAFLPMLHQATIRVNLAVFILCIFIFVYMLSHGSFLGGSGGAYTIEPK